MPDDKVIHLLSAGRSLCAMSTAHGLPNAWPPGHYWTDWTDAIHVTCEACRQRYDQLQADRFAPPRRTKG